MASVGCYVVFIKVSLKYSSRYSEGFEQKNSEDTEGIVCVCVCVAGWYYVCHRCSGWT